MQKGQGLSLASSIGCSLLLAVTTFGIYGASLRNGFVEWDDGYLITENVHIRSITPLTLRHIFTTYDPELYIPLTFLSYQMDYLVWGLNPVGFHLTNLMLHIANAILVFLLVRLLWKDVHDKHATLSPNTYHLTPLFVALLFAVHPLHTEAVAWASARKDVLSAFLALSSLILFLRWQEKRDGRQYWGSVALFFAALLAKVTVVVLPLLLLLIHWFRERHIPQRRLPEYIPYFFLSGIFGIIALFGKTHNVASTSLFEAILLGAKSTIFYLQKLLLPLQLSVLYPYTQDVSFGNLDLLFPLLLTVALLTLAWIARKRLHILTFGIAWYVIALLPSFTTFRKGDDIELDLYFASDRYAYLPSIGLFVLAASLAASFYTGARSLRSEQRCRVILGGLFTALLSMFSLLAVRQAKTWHDTETLFRNVIRVSPNAHIAHNNLGLFEHGRGNFASALAHYDAAMAITPTGRTAYNRGLTYIAQGEEDKAIATNREAIRRNPRHARAHLNLGGLLLEEGNIAEAMEELTQALAIDPNLAFAHFNLGIAYERLGKLTDAEKAYSAALTQEPDDIETLVSLASLFIRKRQLDDALVLLKRAISLQPHHPRYESLLLEIARLQGKRL